MSEIIRGRKKLESLCIGAMYRYNGKSVISDPRLVPRVIAQWVDETTYCAMLQCVYTATIICTKRCAIRDHLCDLEASKPYLPQSNIFSWYSPNSQHFPDDSVQTQIHGPDQTKFFNKPSSLDLFISILSPFPKTYLKYPRKIPEIPMNITAPACLYFPCPPVPYPTYTVKKGKWIIYVVWCCCTQDWTFGGQLCQL